MATYWVETGHGGTDSGTEANPWLTIDQAMNAVAAGDKVWVKASANYNETATMDTAGTEGSPIVFEGYTSSTGDGGRVTISGQSARANGIVSALGAVSGFYVFKNFIVTLCTSDAFDMVAATDNVTYKNCRAFNNGGWGFQGDNNMVHEACDAEDNDAGGFDGDANCLAVGCRAWNNGGVGINFPLTLGLAYGCLVYDNGVNDGMVLGSSISVSIGCTVDGENTGDEGILFAGTSQVAINNILYDWATGLSASTSIGEVAVVHGNLYNSNTANTANIIEGDNKVEAAPGFTNEAGDDYTLASGSAAKAAGIDAAKASLGTSYVDIGALQRQEAGGGGVGVIIGG